MKRFLPYFLCILPLAACLTCCVKEEAYPVEEKAIVFRTGEDLDISTKAMGERTSAANFTCLATKGTSTFISNVKTITSGSYQTISNKYWPASGTLSFYGVLPNVNMTNSSGTVTVPVGSSSAPLNGTEDYIVAAAKDVANATSPVTMSFSHILAHVGTLTLTGSRAGAITTVSSVSFWHPIYGVYNLTSGTWSSTGGSASSALACPSAISGTASKSSSNDFSVIPGTYSLSVTYTVAVGAASKTYTKSGNFTLSAGRKHTISATLSDDFRPLSVSTLVKFWESGSSWTDDCADASATKKSIRVNMFAASDSPWVESDFTIGGYKVYESGNKGSSTSIAGMSVTIKGFSAFDMYVFVSGEKNYDYMLVGNEDIDLNDYFDNNPWKSATSLTISQDIKKIVNREGYTSDDPEADDSYELVQYTGLDASQSYTIHIVYGKDNSVDRGLDKGFVYFPYRD